MTRMVISEFTLSPTFIDEPRDHGPYADCNWEPYCLTHGDMCERHLPECVIPTVEHPICDGGWRAE